MLILGLGCTAQVGKDTAAEYLEKKYPGRAVRVSFADKVKAVVMDLFELSWEQCYGPIEVKEKIDPRYGLSPRQIMMGVGDKLREVYEPIWIECAFRSTVPMLKKKGYDLFIFSDVRYPNEADIIRSSGGKIVRILRDGSGVLTNKEHASETSLLEYPHFDFVVSNNGSIPEYCEKIDKIIEEVGYGREKREHLNGI